MPYYHAFNLYIYSELTFPSQAVLPGLKKAVDVSIYYGVVPPNGLKTCLTQGYNSQANKRSFWLSVPGIARFMVENGRRIIIDPEVGVVEERLYLFVLDVCFGALLVQRGLFLLHGSAVQIGSSVILLVGDNGSGKSTLSMEFLRQGYDIITDNLCAINADGELVPGFQCIKIWNDTVEHYMTDFMDHRIVQTTHDVALIPLRSSERKSSYPIEGVYYLDLVEQKQKIEFFCIDLINQEKLSIFYHSYPQYFYSTFSLLKFKKIVKKLRGHTWFGISWCKDLTLLDKVVKLIVQKKIGTEHKSHLKNKDQHSLGQLSQTLISPQPGRLRLLLTQLQAIWSNQQPIFTDRGKHYWLSSYPKSGNTWVRLFLVNLFKTSHDPLHFEELDEVGFMPSARKWLDAVLGFDSTYLSDDEVDMFRSNIGLWHANMSNKICYYKSHEAYTYFDNGKPRMAIQNSSGVVYIVRNPLDVVVSLANHYGCGIDQAIEHINNPTYEIGNLAYGYSSDVRQRYLGWSENVKSWIAAPNINRCIIRYEDMLFSSLETFTKIANFLQLNVSSQAIQQALASVSFDKLQAIEAESGFHEASASGARFFRKGMVGDWKNVLSVDQVKKIVDVHGDTMQLFGYLD